MCRSVLAYRFFFFFRPARLQTCSCKYQWNGETALGPCWQPARALGILSLVPVGVDMEDIGCFNYVDKIDYMSRPRSPPLILAPSFKKYSSERLGHIHAFCVLM